MESTPEAVSVYRKHAKEPDGSVLRRASRVAILVLLACTAAVNAQIPTSMTVGAILPEATADSLAASVSRAAEQGLVMADEEFVFNAEMLGIEFVILTERASGAEDVVAAADRMAQAGAFGVLGGFTVDEAAALGEWANRTGIPFLNVGASSDSLRNELCAPQMFHIEPSAAMYLDSLAGWYVRSGFRRWYVVVGEDPESRAQHERLLWSLRERHFGATQVGSAIVAPDAVLEPATLASIARERADLVVLLTGAVQQLTLLTQLADEGVELAVAGFPHPDAQTRDFFAASRDAAPGIGANHRASAWEATLDAYGAREINARYRLRWEEPMDPSAWATYQGVKIFYEAAFFGGSTEPSDVVAYLGNPQSVFDVWKGIGASFRPWDNQLRQSLYLVKISEDAADSFTLGILVGELPAIYMPGTDPVERLDQLGDLRAQSRCR